MRDGFVRVASGTPRIALADTAANAEVIIELMREASEAGAKLLVLPELCLTGSTCGDLFLQDTLIQGAYFGLERIIQASVGQDMLTIVGLPMARNGRLFNCAAVVKDGELLAVAPKSGLHARGERSERRWFSEGPPDPDQILCFGVSVPFGELTLAARNMPGFTVSVAFSNSIFGRRHCDMSAGIIACPMAAAELTGGARELEMFACVESKRMACAVVLAGAGAGESTTDMVFAGRRLIAENGKLLSASAPYQTGLTMTEIDASFLQSERMRTGKGGEESTMLTFSVKLEPLALSRHFEALPFVPGEAALRRERCEQILGIQAQALASRMRHVHCESAVMGVSGGLDSTLSMLVAARAIQSLGLPKQSLLAVTMPCFGTTERTKANARKLTQCLGGHLREIDITASVTQHFLDIGHDIHVHDTTYENAQARERTQVLMDIANQDGGIVIGTGDLSELALGWATYNGDHMSMYSVNAGVPKTLVRHLVQHCADHAEGELKGVLLDILNTPVSPELLPPVDGVISQRTEELVGPYELHDFFIYHMLRRMEKPQKIKRLALRAFEGVYDEPTIDKWLKTFLRRFFSQQFKRSCLPDGPGVGSVSLSPRGALQMPSDAASRIWLEDLR